MRNCWKWSSLLAVGAFGLAVVLGPAEAQTRLRFAGNFPEDHTATGAMKIFKEEVEKRSNGELQIDNFPAMQLGGAQENVDQVRSGTIFAVVTSIAYFTRTVPEFETLSLPFLFDTRAKAFAVIDGDVGKKIDAKLLDNGFVSLGYGELGYRHATNSQHPIKSLEDFKGLKIRLQPNEVHLATFRALGANPIAMDVKELYSALQQGVLDGQENPYNIIATRRFNEVQKYLSATGHFYDMINVVANKRAFEKLSPEHQTIVRESMLAAMEWQRAEAERLDLVWRDKLIEAGMEFNEVSPEARAAMRKATASIAEDLKKRVDPALVDQVLTEATK
ncbi:ABC transporter substrate-binding protein [Mesorhizobium sp. L-8-10]|uniref:TRAP transporter substrate-binding protein n=1 Tax=unclassified Mesorhizobium TaxID=325217 RepID=UPI0019257F23|nr:MULTISPECIES: TRAP transporter substrate-binding protein [unclassified Mesorhizobium]BCH26628.1 ABC transporter substrate-binding protein [Mesorhizobium sp. L-8-3]BCH34611.1 ABC transporter substrate-binding protein [Mesorhizobium sp. L-8-10]